MLNVNRSVDDPFYRYKMPRVMAKVEGRGNGIKTVLPNIVDVCKALSRSPAYATKYFGYELGAQTILDTRNDKYVVNGRHEADRLQEILDGFIKSYVLCNECSNPETVLSVRHEKIKAACKACGATSEVNMRHKLSTYILRFPPGTDPSSVASGGPKKERRGKKEKEQAALAAEADAAAAAVQQASNKHVKSKGKKAAEAEDEDDGGDWSLDTSAEAVSKRKAALEAGLGAAARLAASDDLSLSENERMEKLFNFAKRSLSPDGGGFSSLKVHAEAQRLDVVDKGAGVLLGAIFTADIRKEVPRFRKLLLRFTQANEKSQRYFIGCLERFLVAHKLTGKTHLVLKAFYDADVLTEEVLLAWSDKHSKKYVDAADANRIHEASKPFIDWLREADEEDDDDDDDDDDDVVQFTTAPTSEPTSTSATTTSGSMPSVPSSNAATAPPTTTVVSEAVAAVADDDDFDIDDI